MITQTPGLLLSLWTLLAIVVVGTALVISLLQPLVLKRLPRFHLSARAGLLWCAALAPYYVGLYMVLLSQLPSVLFELGMAMDHCTEHHPGQSHLCWAHPAAFHLLGWQGLSAVLFTGLVSGWVCVTVYWAFQHHRYTQLLRDLARREDGIYRLETDIPSAFTAGWLRPCVLVSDALAEGLSNEELAVVIAHERAHQARRDPLLLLIFRLCLGVYPTAIRRRFYQAMQLTLEQMADAAAVRAGNQPQLVAQTLVKVHRLTAQFRTPAAITGGDFFGTCHCSAMALEQRVTHLLHKPTGKVTCAPFPSVAAGLVVIALVAWGLFSAHGVHHFWEAMLHFTPRLENP